MRTKLVFDLRARNANTHKVASPLPNMDGILRRVARAKFRSSMDGKDAYEQIRIIPKHVPRSMVTTPDGNMDNRVIQQGDCNGGATFQAVMNDIFGPYIGIFMDVYLDDIVIYSDTLEDHVKHVKLVMDILRKEQFYLNEKKLYFLASELRLLGQVVGSDGIHMDPEKVDSIRNWKVPTTKEALSGFLGAVGYLADNLPGIRGPMGILNAHTGGAVPFQWAFTEQRAFEEIKNITETWKDHP
jgi:hypothetical protein